MRAVDIIQKKRDGVTLSRAEIEFLIKGYVDGNVKDYQMSAFTMAVFFNGMSESEVADLTRAMAHSGETVDLSPINGIKVDKHSTGGVGDKTSLIIGPIVASLGVPVAKMSGRGLGHTGGTIDKLESIPHFKTEVLQHDFINQVNDIKLSIIGQSGELAPADKMLYALRDVTATVESIPLIASSIMSKKIAAGADAIVLDVKTGSGAFMKTIEDSISLAKVMVKIGTEVERETIAIISDMDQPLGRAIGNALEVQEVIETLSGNGPEDLTYVCHTLAAYMVLLGKKAESFEDALAKVKETIANGQALEQFKLFVQAQGGVAAIVDNPALLPQATTRYEVLAEQEHYVAAINAEKLGIVAMKLGAGRATKEDSIDYAVGLVLQTKVGEQVNASSVLATIHSNETITESHPLIAEIREAFSFSDKPIAAKPLIYAIVKPDGIEYIN